jgi:hypothetical protein
MTIRDIKGGDSLMTPERCAPHMRSATLSGYAELARSVGLHSRRVPPQLHPLCSLFRRLSDANGVRSAPTEHEVNVGEREHSDSDAVPMSCYVYVASRFLPQRSQKQPRGRESGWSTRNSTPNAVGCAPAYRVRLERFGHRNGEIDMPSLPGGRRCVDCGSEVERRPGARP